MKLKKYQIFRNNIKIDSLSPDEWVVLDIVESGKYNYYRVMLNNSKIERPISIVGIEKISNAIEQGFIELKGVRKQNKKGKK